MVVVYNLYIFDRHCECIFYTEWNRPNTHLTSTRHSTDLSRPPVWPSAQSPRNTPMEEEAKLVYGVVFSTRNIINKLNSKDSSKGGNPGGFLSFATNTYRLHYYEALSGVKFAITTDVATNNMEPALDMIYKNIYVEYVVKNPLFCVDPNVSSPIENDYFRAVLNNYIKEISTSSSALSASS
ncbi:TRAPP complex subunit bet5 [Kickxella alabastrina]|nr:TRAPP complex subunit bet5 [Kickxella alabastrina]